MYGVSLAGADLVVVVSSVGSAVHDRHFHVANYVHALMMQSVILAIILERALFVFLLPV